MLKKLLNVPKLRFVQVGLSLVLIGLAMSFDYNTLDLSAIFGFIALTCGIYSLIGEAYEIYTKYLV